MAPPPRRAGAAVPGRHPLVLHAGMQDVGDGHADVVADRVWLRRRRPPQLHRRRRRALFSDLLGLAVGLVRSLRATTRLPLITVRAARHALLLFAHDLQVVHRHNHLMGGGGGGGGGISPNTLAWTTAARSVLRRRQHLPRPHGDERDVGAAQRAVGVRLEPLVDALLVEGVAALGQQPQALPVPELAEAHGAVRGVDRRRVTAPVLAQGDLADQGLVQPRRRRDVPRLLAPGLSLASSSAAAAAAAAGTTATT
uniref:Uncharacterized protein n=1 Tax=Zea mays TaxID=4577 RepID=A0A804MB69_MAIZE